ncbi:MAG: hypothetical protein K2X38_17045 [Gemmataceae bacterium]|nr:hypothetical protein [Gemmataceae bacterium]
MIFRKGTALPEFAAFILLKDEAGTQAFDEYFREFIDIAARHGTGLLLETVAWRANDALRGAPHDGTRPIADNRSPSPPLAAWRSDAANRQAANGNRGM